jgi:hypothetical protein
MPASVVEPTTKQVRAHPTVDAGPEHIWLPHPRHHARHRPLYHRRHWKQWPSCASKARTVRASPTRRGALSYRPSSLTPRRPVVNSSGAGRIRRIATSGSTSALLQQSVAGRTRTIRRLCALTALSS